MYIYIYQYIWRQDRIGYNYDIIRYNVFKGMIAQHFMDIYIYIHIYNY